MFKIACGWNHVLLFPWAHLPSPRQPDSGGARRRLGEPELAGLGVSTAPILGGGRQQGFTGWGEAQGAGFGQEGEFWLFWPIHSPEGDLGRSFDPSGLGLAIEKTRELACVRCRQSGSLGSPSLFGINSHPSSWAILPFPFLLNQGLFWKLL